MEVFFKKETIEALVKAGVKSEPFHEENVWRGKDIDTDEIMPKDFAIIREVIGQSKHNQLIENRRVIRKLDALDAIKGNPKKGVVKQLEVLVEALRRLIEPTPHKWVFVSNLKYGVMLPYLVSKIRYQPAEKRRDSYTPACVFVALEAVCRGHESNATLAFYIKDVGKTADEILAKEDAYVETPVLVKQYEADLDTYHREAPKTGEQYLAHGIGQASEGGSWHKKSICFEKDGSAAKVVMDDTLDYGSHSAHTATNFWSDKRGGRDDDEDEQSFALPLHPILRVFHLGIHEYIDAHVSSVEPYKYDETVGEKLVLPVDHRELIDALTSSAIKQMDDIICGKARGLIILCSGKPGTGKTLTAEVYSEVAKRPLYMVQCSQLGTKASELEEKLSVVLDRATRWKAILLIDEADVYIHERGSDIEQNAIVGVFLRLLEYYNGILFMNTNRVTTVDDAILSRATAHVKYDIPTEDGTKRRLWRILCQQYGVEPTAAFVNQAIDSFPNISGRSIRQLIRLARVMSDRQSKPVNVAMLRWAAKFHDFTELEIAP